MEEVVNLAALEGSVDFSMMGMFLKSDWVCLLYTSDAADE